MIAKEDYEEPRCPFCMPDQKQTVPISRIVEKLDEYLFKKDFSGAKRHLEYWKTEADALGDFRGKLSILNELVGLSRKTENEKDALLYADEALTLCEDATLCGSITVGTTLLNVATAYKAFGKAKEALPLYERAKGLYENSLADSDDRRAGLYNNYALALMDEGQFERAEELFLKALKVLENVQKSEAERAITYCNLADLITAKDGYASGKEKIETYLKRAFSLLTSCARTDGEFAYACEKCAPIFGYYKLPEYAEKVKKIAEEIYERN